MGTVIIIKASCISPPMQTKPQQLHKALKKEICRNFNQKRIVFSVALQGLTHYFYMSMTKSVLDKNENRFKKHLGNTIKKTVLRGIFVSRLSYNGVGGLMF